MSVIISIPADPDAGAPSGFDSVIASVPDPWYAGEDPAGPLLIRPVARRLRRLSDESAEMVGERLHHAEWSITGDLDEVRTKGTAHGCPECLAGVARATEYLEANPGRVVAVGQLWWQ